MNLLRVDVIDPEGLLTHPARPFNNLNLGRVFTARTFRHVSKPSGEAVATIIILNGNHRAKIALETSAQIIAEARAAGPVIFVSMSMGKKFGLRAPKKTDQGETWVQMLIPFGIPQPHIHLDRALVNQGPLVYLEAALGRYTTVPPRRRSEDFGSAREPLPYDEEPPSHGIVRSHEAFSRRQDLPTLRAPSPTAVLEARLDSIERRMGDQIETLERRVANLEAELRVARATPPPPRSGGVTREVALVDVQQIASRNGLMFTIGAPSRVLIANAAALPHLLRESLGKDNAILLFYRSGARVGQSQEAIGRAARQIVQMHGIRHVAVVVIAASDPVQDDINAEYVEGVFTLRTNDDYSTIAMSGRHGDQNAAVLISFKEWVRSSQW